MKKTVHARRINPFFSQLISLSTSFPFISLSSSPHHISCSTPTNLQKSKDIKGTVKEKKKSKDQMYKTQFFSNEKVTEKDDKNFLGKDDEFSPLIKALTYLYICTKRIPMIIVLFGINQIGKSTLSISLSQLLPLSSVIQTDAFLSLTSTGIFPSLL